MTKAEREQYEKAEQLRQKAEFALRAFPVLPYNSEASNEAVLVILEYLKS